MKNYEVDFSEIKTYYRSFNFYNEQTSQCLDNLIEFYNSKIEETVAKLKSIFDFYQYNNLENFIGPNNDIPELKFVYGGCDFSIKILLSYKNGVSETHSNYGIIINEPDIPFSFNFENSTIEDTFYEKVWEYKFVVFHVWFSHLWQSFEFYKCGLKVNISDGQCSDFFYLNDFKWKDKSLTTNNNNYPIKEQMNKELTPFKIFENLRANTNIFC